MRSLLAAVGYDRFWLAVYRGVCPECRGDLAVFHKMGCSTRSLDRDLFDLHRALHSIKAGGRRGESPKVFGRGGRRHRARRRGALCRFMVADG